MRADQDVLEVETNKATLSVSTPCGRVKELRVKENESYPVGAVLGYLEATVEDIKRLGLDEPVAAAAGHEPASGVDGAASADGSKREVQPTIRGLPRARERTGPVT